MSKPWHDEELLREMYEDGMSVNKIAEELGCSQPNITYWFKKHGIDTREIDERYKSEEWLAEKAEEMSVEEMADEAGVHPQTIYLWLHDADIPTPSRKNT